MILRPALPPEQAAALLADVIASAPAFDYNAGTFQPGELEWLGRAGALLDRCGSPLDCAEFAVARKNLYSYTHNPNAMLSPLHKTLASVELDLPTAKQGAFIPAGDTWNGFAAIVQLLTQRGGRVLIVDPYIDGSFIVNFLPLATQLEAIRCLTSGHYRASIEAASERWQTDRKPLQPVDIRLVDDARGLHDRIIMFDSGEVYLVSQSFKDIGARSPASIQRAAPEVAAMKIAHYELAWGAANQFLNWGHD